MANRADRYPENVSGRYYVDHQCIDCDLCRTVAPLNFVRHEGGGYSYVYKQPSGPEQEAACKQARDECPVDAIGDE